MPPKPSPARARPRARAWPFTWDLTIKEVSIGGGTPESNSMVVLMELPQAQKQPMASE